MTSVRDYITAKKKKSPELRIGSLKEISEAQKRPPMTSGNVVFDYVTSIGGLPRGVVTEIRGENSSGKSTLAAMIAGQHQKRVKAGEATGAVLYLDFEYAVSKQYFQDLGVDVDDEETFVYYQPDTLEDGFNMFLDMTREGLLALGVIDSVAGASAEAEYEATIGKLSVGLKARAFHQALRMCIGPMKVHGTGLILINHVQTKIPQTFGEKQAAMRGIQETISPGGRAIEFYTSVRINLAKPQAIKNEVIDELTNDKSKQVTNVDVVVTAFKNKVGQPHRTGKMRINFGTGFNPTYSAFNILVDHGIIKKKTGGHYEIPEALRVNDDKLAVGEDKLIASIDADPEWRKLINDFASQLVLKVQVEQNFDSVVLLDGDEDPLIDMETGEVLSDD